MSDIGTRYRQLERDRMRRSQELMEEYDRTVYYPAVQAVRAECAATPEGHRQSRYHDNGLGWHWWYCGRCGAAHGKERYATKFEDEE